MKKLRFRIILLTCWLIGLFILTKIWEPINLNISTYLFLLVLSIFVLITPGLMRKQGWLLLAIPVLLFLTITVIVEQPLVGNSLMFIIAETVIIYLTALLLLWVRAGIHEFETSVAQITIGNKAKMFEASCDGQSVLYREVRRARNHNRPLALLAIAVDEKSIKSSMEQMVKEAQQNIIKQFTLTKVSNTLSEKLEDCDVVVQTNSHFLVVLPETKPEDLPSLLNRIRQHVSDQVGVDLKVGTASLPQDGFTFEGLLDKATLEMQATMDEKLFIDPEQLFAKHKIT